MKIFACLSFRVILTYLFYHLQGVMRSKHLVFCKSSINWHQVIVGNVHTIHNFKRHKSRHDSIVGISTYNFSIEYSPIRYCILFR